MRGSQKTFWRLNCKQGDNTLIIGEAVIDALSHNILFPNETAIYAATGGGMSPEQCMPPEKFEAKFFNQMQQETLLKITC